MWLFRSIVGKLWGTILLLVSVVLTILLILLLQYFNHFHTEQAENQLLNHASLMASMLENENTANAAFVVSSSITEAYSTRAVLIFDDVHYWISPDGITSEIPIDVIMEHRDLFRVITERETIVTGGDFRLPIFHDGEEKVSVMIVGMPITLASGENGSLFLYQSLDIVEDATNQTKRIIYLSAAIAIVLTTIFAFFLTTRITSPLRKMRTASLEVAKGNFDVKVPILTNDEMGLLGIAFNRMARTLKINLNALRQEKEQLSRILSSMADGVITLDRQGSIVVTNPPADEFISAWEYEKSFEKDENDSGNLPKVLVELFEKVVREEKEQMGEVDLLGRSWVILMTPLYDEEYVRGAVAVLRDMTEERLHDKLRKDFVANVSHELRTPISMLQGYSEALIDGIAESEEEKMEMMKIIYDESLRIGRLVNDLLDIARMEAGHIQLNIRPTNLTECCKRVYRKFQVVANDNNIHLVNEINHIDRLVQVDEDRIEQVLTNLIDNAIRHTSEEGSVTLKLEDVGNGVKIHVKDTGSGIPEEDLPFVFERFYKADKARTRGQSGTGLGLAIVKNIVDAHNGKVSAHSKLNEGTTFTVFLPYKSDL